jgi:hypothetical protein
MRQALLLAAVVVAAAVGAPLAAASPTAAPTDAGAGQPAAVQEAPGNDSENDSEPAPGAQLAGVVNVQAAEVEGDLQQRSFGLQLGAARSNASKATVVANQTGELSDRLDTLQERKQRLLEAKRNGSISQARFRAEMAGLAAEIATANRLLNRTSDEADGLPSEALAEAGVDAEDLDRLRQAAGNLTGPEIARIARSIGGPPVNVSVGPPGNRTRGPPEDVELPEDVSLPPGVTVEDLPDDIDFEDLPEDVTIEYLQNLTDSDLSNVSVDDLFGEGDAPENGSEAGGSGDPGNSSESSDENDDGPDATTSVGAPGDTGPPENTTTTPGGPAQVAWLFDLLTA